MFSIDLSNGTKLTIALELGTKPAVRVQQVATVTGGTPPTGAITIPLADVRKVADTAVGLAKAFKGG